MRTYVLVSGVIFALVLVAHIARMIVEPGLFATDPFFLALTALVLALAVWAGRLYWSTRRGG
jgi:hypothetical protein